MSGRVKSIEKMLGAQAVNLFIGFDSVIVGKDAEIARFNTLVEQLKDTIANLEDNLDDREVHEMTQSVANDGSNQQTPSNSHFGKMDETGNDTSGEIAQHPSSAAGQLKASSKHEVKFVENVDEVEDLTVDNADGYVKGHSDAVGGVNVGVFDIGTSCEGKTAASRHRPEITSLVRCVKNKSRCEFRLSDNEYIDVVGRGRHNSRVVLRKSSEPGKIYTVEDVDVEHKTWNGFGMELVEG
ncbi:hypothetical protein ACSBR2_041482 [Camellia fascicularis]